MPVYGVVKFQKTWCRTSRLANDFMRNLLDLPLSLCDRPHNFTCDTNTPLGIGHIEFRRESSCMHM